MVGEYRFLDAAELADRLCQRVTERLHAALKARGAASLIVSGGKTPLALFQRLARIPLPWDQVWIGLADERWVDTGDTASNERFVREHLLKSAAAAAHFIGMKNAAPNPALGAAHTWVSYAKIPRPFDVVLLGMGDDGHTASLFPGNPSLPTALDSKSAPACVAMEAPVDPRPRLSLNVPALTDARGIIVASTGDSKWRVFRAACAAGSELDYPVRAILRQEKTPVDFFWAP
jgi:6-phosphogluconolactonase